MHWVMRRESSAQRSATTPLFHSSCMGVAPNAWPPLSAASSALGTELIPSLREPGWGRAGAKITVEMSPGHHTQAEQHPRLE